MDKPAIQKDLLETYPLDYRKPLALSDEDKFKFIVKMEQDILTLLAKMMAISKAINND